MRVLWRGGDGDGDGSGGRDGVCVWKDTLGRIQERSDTAPETHHVNALLMLGRAPFVTFASTSSGPKAALFSCQSKTWVMLSFYVSLRGTHATLCGGARTTL